MKQKTESQVDTGFRFAWNTMLDISRLCALHVPPEIWEERKPKVDMVLRWLEESGPWRVDGLCRDLKKADALLIIASDYLLSKDTISVSAADLAYFITRLRNHASRLETSEGEAGKEPWCKT